VVYNYDFTGVTPAPPYTSVSVPLGVTFSTFGQHDISFIIFDGLNGSGTSISAPTSTNTAGFIAFNMGILGSTLLLDGVFSIAISVIQDPGSVDIDAISASGVKDGNFGNESSISPTVGTLSAPEPGSLWLFGIAPICLMASRRRNLSMHNC
jgi:hypothetical protein